MDSQRPATVVQAVSPDLLILLPTTSKVRLSHYCDKELLVVRILGQIAYNRVAQHRMKPRRDNKREKMAYWNLQRFNGSMVDRGILEQWTHPTTPNTAKCQSI